MFLGLSPAFHQPRPPATRPQVVAVLTLAATCPTFVGSPYRLKLQAAKVAGCGWYHRNPTQKVGVLPCIQNLLVLNVGSEGMIHNNYQ